jgi:hypothetical protein
MKLIQGLIYFCSLYLFAAGGLDTLPVFAESPYVLMQVWMTQASAANLWPALSPGEDSTKTVRNDKAIMGQLLESTS